MILNRKGVRVNIPTCSIPVIAEMPVHHWFSIWVACDEEIESVVRGEFIFEFCSGGEDGEEEFGECYGGCWEVALGGPWLER